MFQFKNIFLLHIYFDNDKLLFNVSFQVYLLKLKTLYINIKVIKFKLG